MSYSRMPLRMMLAAAFAMFPQLGRAEPLTGDKIEEFLSALQDLKAGLQTSGTEISLERTGSLRDLIADRRVYDALVTHTESSTFDSPTEWASFGDQLIAVHAVVASDYNRQLEEAYETAIASGVSPEDADRLVEQLEAAFWSQVGYVATQEEIDLVHRYEPQINEAFGP